MMANVPGKADSDVRQGDAETEEAPGAQRRGSPRKPMEEVQVGVSTLLGFP